MKHAKQKSSGWLPADKRGPWQERQELQVRRHIREARRDCEVAQLWASCPSGHCWRARNCTGKDPRRCLMKHREAQLARPRSAETPKPATAPAAARGTNGLNTKLPPMSAQEAAALIAQSIAAEPPEPLLGADFRK
ncbi:MAG TPA: hypothetical protein VGH13_14220 [Xanthobacteraceae bacterium]|jgi:hypothetical protein